MGMNQGDWIERVQNCAIAFAVESQTAFKLHLDESDAYLPAQVPAHKMRQLDIFLDVVVSSTVALITQFGGDSVRIEEHMLKTVKEKFTLIRIHKLKNE